MKEVDLLPPSINDLQFGRFLRNGEGLHIFFSNFSATKPLSELKIRIHVFGTFYPKLVVFYNISDQPFCMYFLVHDL
jgi:hypothetical protein